MNIIKILFSCLLVLSLSACEADDFYERDYDDRHLYEIERVLEGRHWTGDIGMDADNGEALFSTFCFDLHHRGVEIQYYQSDGFEYASCSFKWYTEFCPVCGASRIVLDYGPEGVSFMDDVYFRGSSFYGVFFLSRHDHGYDFKLRME